MPSQIQIFILKSLQAYAESTKKAKIYILHGRSYTIQPNTSSKSRTDTKNQKKSSRFFQVKS
uniref:Uncharacterized protein n=1 Tax=Rhizophora mucronata TaxID=61149 RepID=A0A2P2NSE4_RHIMU